MYWKKVFFRGAKSCRALFFILFLIFLFFTPTSYNPVLVDIIKYPLGDSPMNVLFSDMAGLLILAIHRLWLIVVFIMHLES